MLPFARSIGPSAGRTFCSVLRRVAGQRRQVVPTGVTNALHCMPKCPTMRGLRNVRHGLFALSAAGDSSHIWTCLASVGFRDTENGPFLYEGAAHAWRPDNVLSPREELARGQSQLAAAGGCGYSSACTWRRVKHAEAISDTPPRRTPHAIRLTTNRRDSSIGK
jgi:hypothetical protein